jgi:hypothetical protein
MPSFITEVCEHCDLSFLANPALRELLKVFEFRVHYRATPKPSMFYVSRVWENPIVYMYLTELQ